MDRNKKRDREVYSSKEEFDTDGLIINVIYKNEETGSMFYVTSKPEPVPNKKGWFYYDVRKMD